MRGKVFEHYDNFSHWALVIKTILNTGRFPNFSDSIITFQTYPLGTAAYIYYFCKFSSQAESFQMLAQAYMMVSCILPCFSFLKRNKLLGAVLFIITANYLLCYNITIYNLLVDTILPLSGTATILFIYVHVRRRDMDCCSNIYLAAIPMLCWTAQIKNSGLFFCAIAIVVLLSFPDGNPKSILKKLIASVSPLVTLMLWNRHCDYVFPTASTSKHAMRLDNFQSVFSQKEQEDLVHIVKEVIQYAITRKDLLYMLLFIGILALITWIFLAEIRKKSRNLIITAICIYTVYVACVTGMYMFSMPAGEARNLAGLARYVKTIDISIYILILCYGFDLLSSLEKKHIGSAVGCMLILVQMGLGLVRYDGFVTIFHQYSATQRTVLQDFLKENPVPKGGSYLICVPGSNSGYYQYLGKYLMDTTECRGMNVTDKSKLGYYWDKYDYVLIVEENNPEIDAWLRENQPDKIGSRVFYNERS